MGTPSAVWSTMCRCWQMEPTSDRIVEDVTAFERTLDVLIKAEGCVVPDEFLRTGRRARRADDKGDCVHKPRASQRKSTLVARPCHVDCKEALRMLTTPGALTDMELLADELGLLMDADDEEDDIERALPYTCHMLCTPNETERETSSASKQTEQMQVTSKIANDLDEPPQLSIPVSDSV